MSLTKTGLALQEEQYVYSTAKSLGLPHGAEDAEQLLLFQMPSVLPQARSRPPPDPGPHGRAAAAASSAGSREAAQFEELPPGQASFLRPHLHPPPPLPLSSFIPLWAGLPARSIRLIHHLTVLSRQCKGTATGNPL